MSQDYFLEQVLQYNTSSGNGIVSTIGLRVDRYCEINSIKFGVYVPLPGSYFYVISALVCFTFRRGFKMHCRTMAGQDIHGKA